MPDQFKHYWPLTAEEKREVWDTGIFIIDTNVLLHVYRIREEERANLLKVFSDPTITSRLWIPHRVAEEFFRNRLAVIRQQTSSAKTFLDAVEKAIKDVGDAAQKIKKLHPIINRDHWLDKIHEVINTLKDEYEIAKINYPFSVRIDPVVETIRILMQGRLGRPFDKEKISEFMKEGEIRYKNKVPPGYRDGDKEPERAIGDFLIWKQICIEMGERKSHAVFVLDDSKDDWWLKEEGQLLGPRPELREEFHNATEKEIDFVTSERFVAWVSERMNNVFNDDVLDKLISALVDSSSGQTPPNATDNALDILHLMEDEYTHAENSQDIEELRALLLGIGIEAKKEPPTAEMMAEWFLENYEDPAQGVPYETKEGGYQYTCGGPYDVKEEIYKRFPTALESVVDRAVGIVDQSSDGLQEWVRKGDY